MDIQSLLSTGLAVITIATLAGLGLLRGTVTNLREQLSDARGEIASLKDGRTERDTEIATLTSDLAALQRIVTGEIHWVALEEKLDVHHEVSQEHWRRAEDLLESIRDRITEERR